MGLVYPVTTQECAAESLIIHQNILEYHRLVERQRGNVNKTFWIIVVRVKGGETSSIESVNTKIQ